jgi:uncharacterized membrane protein YfhO
VVEQIPGKMRYTIYRSALLFFAMAFLLYAFRRKKISVKVFMFVLIGIAVMDLGLYSRQFVKSHEYKISEVKKKLATRVSENPEPGRAITSRPLFASNDGSRYGFETINGYDPLVLERYILYLQASQRIPPDRHVLTTNFLRNSNHKFLEMLNVKYAFMGNAVTKLDTFLPRVTLASKAVVKSADDILPFMESEAFDPRTTVVLEPKDRHHVISNHTTGSFEGACRLIEYENEILKIESSSSGPCYLVLSEIFYPGWIAKVDGKKVPVLRGNYMFRVIPLGEGNHEIEMRFVSRPFRMGLIVTLSTLIASIVLLFLTQRRKSERVTKSHE